MDRCSKGRTVFGIICCCPRAEKVGRGMKSATASLLSAFGCAFALAACSGGDDSATPTTQTRAASTTEARAAPSTSSPATDTSSPRTVDNVQLAEVVARDVQAGAVAQECDFCDPYASYVWLTENRGYPALTEAEFEARMLEVCSMPAAQRDSDRVNIALRYLDAGSDRDHYCD
jgi:hypothetical protein